MPVSERWVGAGSSQRPAPGEAGREATLAALDGRAAALLVVFASASLEPRALLASIRAHAPGAELIGCSTAGEISSSGPRDCSVVVTAFGGEGFSAATAVGRDASRQLRAAGAAAAGCGDRVADKDERILILLSDGLAGDQQEIVKGAYGVVGAATPLVGGCAGDDLRMKETHQFHGDEILTDAAVGAAISSDGAFGIGVRHGWRRVGDPMLVTASAGTRVRTIDGGPAIGAYLDRLDASAEIREDAAAFAAFAQTHPLGLVSRRGEERVRFVGGADFDTGELICIAEVPEGALVWLMEGDEESVLAATDEACTSALEPLAGRDPLGLLAFDCIARRGVLGDDGIGEEVARIAGHAAGAPLAGFYTYGEIARTTGIAAFHNQTLVVLAVG